MFEIERQTFWFSARSQRTDGFAPAKRCLGNVTHTFRDTDASLLMCLLCLSVRLVSPPSAVALQDGSNPETGSAANTLSGKWQRREGRRRKTEAQAGGGHPFEFERQWGNVGHAYLRNHCWREGSVVAGSE